jgi:hypothetical protein
LAPLKRSERHDDKSPDGRSIDFTDHKGIKRRKKERISSDIG